MAINSTINRDKSLICEFLMLQIEVNLAHDEYRKQLRSAFKGVSDAEQEFARTNEALLLAATKLADGLVKWGDLVFESLRSEDGLDLPDSQVRTMVTHYAEVVAEFLKQATETDDDYSTRIFSEQAKKVADILFVVQRSWHWTDIDRIEEARRQYQCGELMDFETFKNELLAHKK